MFQEFEAAPRAESEPPFMPSKEVLESIRHIPCGEPDSFGATPLDYQSAYTQQVELLEGLQELVDIDIDESIPASIREYMKDTLAMRFWGRATANHDKFITALRSPEQFVDTPDAYDMICRGLTGHASPAELLLVGDMLGTSGIELGCVSIPYGKRIGEVAVMRGAVSDSIEALKGTIIHNHPPRYIVRGIVNAPMWQSEKTDGFLMTRKRNIGSMPDGTIVRERTSFILRADVEGVIPEQNLEAIRALNPEDANWRSDVVAVGGLGEIATNLLEADQFSLAIPVSCTIYAFNEERSAEIAQRRERKRQEEAFCWDDYPALKADRDQLIIAQQNGEIRDSKGMLLKPVVIPFGEAEIKEYLTRLRMGTLASRTDAREDS